MMNIRCAPNAQTGVNSRSSVSNAERRITSFITASTISFVAVSVIMNMAEKRGWRDERKSHRGISPE